MSSLLRLDESCKLPQWRVDSTQIGPWSLWQGNLDADLMIVGQDWGDENYFFVNKGREARSNPTNNVLRELLLSAGIEINAPSGIDIGSLFFTNAILCLKAGGMQAKVKGQWFENCGKRFLRPTIDIVRPRILVALGARAYRSISGEYDFPPLEPFRAAVECESGFRLTDTTRLFVAYHCGARILNTHRSKEKQHEDWTRIGHALKAAKAGS